MTDNRLPAPILEYWEWQGRAACRGMDSATFFYPPSSRGSARQERIDAAKAICHTCLAVTDCLDHALRVREPYGVWGGLSEDERALLLAVTSPRSPAKPAVDALPEQAR